MTRLPGVRVHNTHIRLQPTDIYHNHFIVPLLGKKVVALVVKHAYYMVESKYRFDI